MSAGMMKLLKQEATMEKLNITTAESTTESQSSQTDFLLSQQTDLDILKDKMINLNKNRGAKPKESFVPEIAICEIHGKYESTKQFRPGGKVFKRQCPECELLGKKEIEEKEEKKQFQAQVTKYILESGVPKRYKGKVLGSVDKAKPGVKEIVNSVLFYMNNFENAMQYGASGFFSGECGTGKTMFGCIIVENAIKKGYHAKYITAWDLIQELRKGYSYSDITVKDQLAQFIKFDLLVIDEVGVQRGSEDERILLYQVLDGRYNEIKSTILISNSKNPVKDGFLDLRTIDRLKEGGGFSISFTGESYRK